MKKVTLEQVQERQRAAQELKARNHNRVQLWYNIESGEFRILELTGQDYTVSESSGNLQLPWNPDLYSFDDETGAYRGKKERELALLADTIRILDEIDQTAED